MWIRLRQEQSWHYYFYGSDLSQLKTNIDSIVFMYFTKLGKEDWLRNCEDFNSIDTSHELLKLMTCVDNIRTLRK